MIAEDGDDRFLPADVAEDAKCAAAELLDTDKHQLSIARAASMSARLSHPLSNASVSEQAG